MNIPKPLVVLMLVGAVAAAILAPFAMMNKQNQPQGIDQVLFAPAKYPEGDWHPQDLKFQDVYFQSEDRTRLHGWYCPAENPKGFILILHGNGGNLSSRAPFLKHLQNETRASVFIFDYRGYGHSEGVPSIDNVIQDARLARLQLSELASIADSEMILIGESLGGAIAVQLAAESAPRGLILQSTFSSLRDMAEIHFPNYVSKVSPKIMDSKKQIALFQGELLQSHGEKDSIIPIALGRKLFDAANDPKSFHSIPDADHNSWMNESYLKLLDEFIQRVGPRSFQ